MEQIELEKQRERGRHRRIVDEWKAAAKDIKAASDKMGKKILHREAKREALTVIEDAARTQVEFENVIVIWEKLERTEEERIADHREMGVRELNNRMLSEHGTIIPPPTHLVWWRQQLSGSFLDTIFDCPYEIHELTSDHPVYGLAEDLDENRKEIMYYWAIRQWSPQRIAAMRGQTDRNIRKVYNKMTDDLSYELFYYLYWRYKKCLPITNTQMEFVIAGIEKYAGKTEVTWELNDVDKEGKA